MEEAVFGIEELVERVMARVEDAGLTAPSGQVADALTVRNVRYYATLGLLDPPAARRGRNVLYSDAHVDQLVAVKRLQAEGLHLAEIQRALVGLTADQVRALAAGEGPPADRFWAARPAAASPSAPAAAAPVTSAPYPQAVVIDLGDGVGLQVPPDLALTTEAVDRVVARARTVLGATSATGPSPLIQPNRTQPQRQEHRR
jgi:DNA-binding transcriptional MerR regulator